jgi:hypothetical protein
VAWSGGGDGREWWIAFVGFSHANVGVVFCFVFLTDLETMRANSNVKTGEKTKTSQKKPT